MPIVKDGLIAYYNAKQGVVGDQWLDLSGNDLHLTLTGTTLQSDGIYFDGVDDRARSDWDAFTPTEDYTVEIGIKKLAQSKTVYILYSYAGGAYERNITSNSSERLRINDGIDSHVSAYTLPSGEMVRITIRRVDDLNHDVFINGEYNSTITTGQFIRGFWGTITLGNDGGSNFINATYAYVRLYDRSLSNAEITQNSLVGLEVGLDEDPGVDVTHSYSMQQNIYADRRYDLTTLQSVYSDLSSIAALSMGVYAWRSIDDAITKQIVHAERSADSITSQIIYDNLTKMAVLRQSIYADQLTKAGCLQQVHAIRSEFYATSQVIYLSVTYDFSMFIIVYEPSDHYRQKVYYHAQIKRQLGANVAITRSKQFGVRI